MILSNANHLTNFLLFVAVLYSYLPLPCFTCKTEEKAALIEFKSHFTVNKSSNHCSSSKILSWNTGDEDCCGWSGVQCDETNGHVISLHLQTSCLYGTIPQNSSLFDLIHLEELFLSFNNLNNSQISPLFDRFKNLTVLDLRDAELSGVVPSQIFQLQKLKNLDLSGNVRLTGNISGINASQLVYLELTGTSFVGELPDSLGELKSLQTLAISGCRFSGEIPTSLGKLTQLYTFNVSYNNFTGKVPSSFPKLQNIAEVDLSHNNLEGTILSSLFQLENYTHLDLSSNKFNDTIDLKILKNLQELEYLDLSNSGLSITSTHNDSDFLSFVPSVRYLGLSSCGLKTNFLKNLSTESYLSYLDLSKNNIGEELDSSICNVYPLYYLDLSQNRLTGRIPSCFGNSSENLSMLNLQGNNFYGTIPQSLGYSKKLQLLDLSDNSLEGNIPGSLVNCSQLEVLNLGKNKLDGGYPYWLGNLSSLKVLVLRENKISGELEQASFPSLHIIDVSHNNLSGALPSKYFENFEAMKVVDDEDGPLYAHVQRKAQYISYDKLRSNNIPCSLYTCSKGRLQNYYYYSLDIMNKGLLLPYKRVLTAMKVIDLSGNMFMGNIPPSIGKLRGIRVLNISGNLLTGQVPWFLGNITYLESLDLSRNILSGEIPRELSTLNYLGYLDMSQNRLTGMIPRGGHLDTFSNDSYVGNPGLCGSPLSRVCKNIIGSPNLAEPNFPSKDKHHYSFNFNEFGWEIVLVGYGGGLLFGLILGFFVPVWYEEWLARTFNTREISSY